MPKGYIGGEASTEQVELSDGAFEYDELEVMAFQLAEGHSVSRRLKRGFKLFPQLRSQEKLFQKVYTFFKHTTDIHVSLSYAAEWLLDNYYIVQQACHQIREDMPKGYYRQLPKLDKPPLKEHPRVYGLARGLILNCDSLLDIDRLSRFVIAYQQVSALTIAEVWALPTMLRLAVFESLASALASITGLSYATLSSIDVQMGGKSSKSLTAPEGQATVEATDLADTDPIPEGSVTDEIIVANCILSLRMLATQDWKAFFENVNLVEQELRCDPAEIYPCMDFETRDRYREAVEELARATGRSEVEIAGESISLAQKELVQTEGSVGNRWEAPRSVHVGFYLMDKGRELLESRIGYRPPWIIRFRRWFFDHALLIYLGCIFLVSLVLLIILEYYGYSVGGTLAQLIGVGILAFIPGMVVGVFLVNWLLTETLPQRLLPKLDFHEGVPSEFRTMVVIPTLLTTESEVNSLLHRLEIHFISNADPHLHFALLTDFADAPQKQMPGDDLLLDQASQGIKALNEKYSQRPTAASAPVQGKLFYLFHRERVWNPGEACWMGWERKRGKLAEFNHLLSGSQNTTYIVSADNLDILSEIKYVITLDTDTTLPRDSARGLVATLAHPLNHAEFDPGSGAVVAGYTVLQPRVQVAPTSANRTLFTKIFTGDTAVDLYSRAVSEVYQDLFGEGSYVGKGIYDVAAFERSVTDRVPENALLSHDLFEGIHGRVGLVEDSVVFEEYPPHYVAYMYRLHRWVRGDWQLLPWLLPRVPHSGDGRIFNKLSFLDRWKITDNLRRSLVGLSVLALLVAGWLWLPGSAFVWTVVGVLPIIFPIFTSILSQIYHRTQDRTLTRTAQPVRIETMRSLLSLAFLPYRAVLKLDAIVTTLVRLLITRKHLLQWTSAAHTLNVLGTELKVVLVWRKMIVAPIFAVLLGVLISLVNPAAMLAAAPLLITWLFSPQIASWVDKPLARNPEPLSADQLLGLRYIARRTWFFFEQFVGPNDHWLAPDHFQEDPRGLVAHRTSPTNIGLLLLSTLAAYDLGYIGPLELSLRLSDTLESMDTLERHRGHLLNWYDTRSLEPLAPRYVSTVDSGNLAGCLVTLQQACLDLHNAPLLDWRRWEGLLDTLAILDETLLEADLGTAATTLHNHLNNIRRQVLEVQDEPLQWIPLLIRLCEDVDGELPQKLISLIESGDITLDTRTLERLHIWAERTRRHLKSVKRETELLLPWLFDINQPPKLFTRLDTDPSIAEAWHRLENSFPPAPRMDEIVEISKNGLALLAELRERLDEASPIPSGDYIDPPSVEEGFADLIREANEWCARLAVSLDTSRMTAECLKIGYQVLSIQAEAYFRRMDFGFLFDPRRKVFHIGYNVDVGKTDDNYYDLLASEARLASLLAIAKGDVPQGHWMHMARPLTRINGTHTLLSWSGTMFEYLMPTLLNRSYQGTLIDQSCRAAVDHQMAYGQQKGVPWGISESGFFHFDTNMNYQYRAFGVPGLGFKRGLEDDMVITPYASLLALRLRPQMVMQNIKALIDLGMQGPYGFYEAIDFTSSRLPKGTNRAIVRSYMAHHQGMILLALTNCLRDDVMLNRFYADTRVESVDMLLQEQVPPQIPFEYSQPEEAIPYQPIQPRTALETWKPPVNIQLPQVHCLSNGRYKLIISSAGSGYSSINDIDLTRWRSDTTLDDWGTWIYIQDCDNGELWSAGYQPTGGQSQSQEVLFSPYKVEFHRRDFDISTHMAIAVHPEEDIEVRRITLTNHTDRTRRLKITSYGEVVLAPHSADQRHPAFNKLFIESEYIPDVNTLLFRRRPRSISEEVFFLAHVFVGANSEFVGTQFESDRAQFLGRGGTARSPLALRKNSGGLSGSAGATLDPVMVLSQEIILSPHSTNEFAFVTLATGSREKALDLASRFQVWAEVERTFDQAYTNSLQELNQLDLSSHDIERIQGLLSALLYPHHALRASSSALATNVKGQEGLWPFAVSGDYPILLVRVGSQEETALVHDLLKAHGYWRNQGLKIDLVILNLKEIGYEQELQGQLFRLISLTGSDIWMNKRGGVFLLRAEMMSESDLWLFESAARVVLDGEKGSIADQIESQRVQPIHLPRFVPTLPVQRLSQAEMGLEAIPAVERPDDLLYDNGLGGFSADGREYIIYLEPESWTPAPWINVIANSEFGFLVSEIGLGYTWAVNSGENKLTPWRNDPLTEKTGEGIYLRDEETGELWSPTPLPGRAPAPYLVRHGSGYSIFEHNSHGLRQRLRLFAVPNAPVKVVQIKLENKWNRTRRINITYYAEWVLGVSRETMAQYIVPEFDATCHALLARNPYNTEFGDRVAFLAATRSPHGLTADRTEFLGRMGSYSSPAALNRVGLTANVEPGNDPCAAMQILLWLAPGETKEVTFLLGQGANREETIQLIKQYQDMSEVNAAWESVIEFWDDILSSIVVKTPDPALDLLINRWLIYQAFACRVWGRSAFYQSSGAFGYRDQLQDVMALVHTAPEITREHILESMRHQFCEGDVLHWWHPPSGRGVRTRYTDDLLWLPFVTTHYVKTTGDQSILNEETTFLEGDPLGADEEERYGLYGASERVFSLYEHCCRALEKGSTAGPNNLPLMGGGDWNDGMNRVGIEGQGESVWLGWFLYANLMGFAPMCELMGDYEKAAEYRKQADELREALEANAWDGQWYRRAYYDDGTPLGSADSEECQIDSIAQSWAVISGAADPARAAQAMESVAKRLVQTDSQLVLLFAPPFDKTVHDPGYIKGYLPGIRENGGQYTHAAIWTVWGFAELGQGDRAGALLRMLNPIYHSDTREKVDRYRVEPYVVAADIYSMPPHVGRGGWTWYTGSASWMYRLGLETILGLRRLGEKLTINPCIPKHWSGYELTFRSGEDIYHIVVENPEGVNQGVKQVIVDGIVIPEKDILLVGDGKQHEVSIRMGS